MGESLKDAKVFLAVAKEPVLYIEGSRRNASGTSYDNSLYWMDRNYRTNRKLLEGETVCLGVGLERAVEEQMKSQKMKVELIANVSHDIKTPLTSIISYVQFLKEEEGLPEHVKDYVRILDEKSQRLKNMVQDVFAVSKAASGELPVHMEELDFGKLLEQTLADSRVYVTLEAEDGRAVATVKNISMAELDREKDFAERFTRGDQSRTDGGSGLGLSIAQSFTEACGGEFTWETDADMFVVKVGFRVGC